MEEEDYMNMSSLKQIVSKLFDLSIQATIPKEILVKTIDIAPTSDFGDYQCNNAMSLNKYLKGNTTGFEDSSAIAHAIMENLPNSDMIASKSVTGKGFVNVTLSTEWIAQRIQKMLVNGIEIWAPKLDVKRAVVDFSSPNIAKEMHVGHLRSTIIGDTIARMLEFSNVEVLRRNHVGDWGTQFGMLIEFLFDEFPNSEEAGEQVIKDLQEFYKQSKERFDKDPAFKKRAQQAVVRLQGGEEKYHKAWTQICEISRKEFDQVYQRLNVHLEEKGESFYNDIIPQVMGELKEWIQESEGAQVIFTKGEKAPLIVVKSDGGYNYASTDLTALWYRLNEEKADWIIYVTDSGQKDHFEKVFSAAKLAGWLSDQKKYPKVTHVGFGVVLGDDKKKLRTRSSTKVVRLADLLDEAKSRSKTEIEKKIEKRGKTADWTEEEIEEATNAAGYGSVKYADLKNKRDTDYIFSYERMLSDKGNTAFYLLYAHARICSIVRMSGRDIEELKQTGTVVLGHTDERALGLHLLRFAEILEEAITDLYPHIVCEYLYRLSENFTTFYSNCQVLRSAEEESRLLLCEATAIVMRECFYLLGITPVYKI